MVAVINVNNRDAGLEIAILVKSSSYSVTAWGDVRTVTGVGPRLCHILLPSCRKLSGTSLLTNKVS